MSKVTVQLTVNVEIDLEQIVDKTSSFIWNYETRNSRDGSYSATLRGAKAFAKCCVPLGMATMRDDGYRVKLAGVEIKRSEKNRS